MLGLVKSCIIDHLQKGLLSTILVKYEIKFGQQWLPNSSYVTLTVYILFCGITYTHNHTKQQYETLKYPEAPPLTRLKI